MHASDASDWPAAPALCNPARRARVPMPIFPDLRGKVAVVTGASRGIGAAVARQFAANGMKVVVSDTDSAALERVAESIRTDGGRVITAAADCTRDTDLVDLRQRAEWEWDAVDVLAACADGNIPAYPGGQGPPADWSAGVDANLKATFLTVQAFLPRMVERGRGSVITLASAAAPMQSLPAAAFGASQAGVAMLTRHLAREYRARGIRFNCIAPAILCADQSPGEASTESPEVVGTRPSLEPMGTPEDAAHAALYLASGASGRVMGVTLDLAGCNARY